jgi:hypothetical protein
LSVFEIAAKKTRNGRRRLKVSLHEIYPDNTKWNDNGISWLEEYTDKAKDSVIGSSITCEFADEERSELLGHGLTGTSPESLPIFENSTMVGVFDKSYIQEITENNETKKVLIGEGYIDEMRYKNLVTTLEEKYQNGETISGSVEIMGTPENENRIVYEDGWKETGRVPYTYVYSGYALLGVKPADQAAKLLEMNQKKEEQDQMDEKILSAFVSDIKNALVEVNSKNDEQAKIIAERDATISELNASVAQIQAAMTAVQAERDDYYQKLDTSYAEMNLLREELAKAKVAERLGELNAALADFSDEEKAYAQVEINSFNENPLEGDISKITKSIFAVIGEKALEAKRKAEQDAKDHPSDTSDIFSEVFTPKSDDKDNNDEIELF